MIQVSNIEKSFGTRVLFQNLSFNINSGERIGLVGRNGAGKSTFLNILSGDLSPDSGQFVFPKNYRVARLEQHIKFKQTTLLKECSVALENPEESYLVEKCLFGLGFKQADLEKSPQSFSSGFQLRIQLAKLLLKQPNLLLLDEPTNYLDIISMRWLAQYIRNYPGEVILVTHDKVFMDNVVTHIVGLFQGQAKKIEGDTSKYREQIILEEDLYDKQRKNLERKRKDLERFIERFRAKASKATQAQSKIKQLEKMEVMEERFDEQQLEITFPYKENSIKSFLSVEDLHFAYGQNVIVDKLSFYLNQKERLAIIGPNGKGKSTLLKLLAGELASQGGKLKWHPQALISHYDHDQIKALEPQNTIIDEVLEANEKLSMTQVRNLCASVLFPGEDCLKKIDVLSGGERARVCLGKVLARQSQVLLLDEPTNHFDLESVEGLAGSLKNYPGPIILVSHNEWFLEQLATRLIIFQNGEINIFEGSYGEFLQQVGWSEEKGEKKTPNKKRASKHERAEFVKERAKALKPLEKQIEQLEMQIEKREKVIQEIESRWICEQVDGPEMAQMQKEWHGVKEEVETLYSEMDKAMQLYDDKKDDFDKKEREL